MAKVDMAFNQLDSFHVLILNRFSPPTAGLGELCQRHASQPTHPIELTMDREMVRRPRIVSFDGLCHDGSEGSRLSLSCPC